MGTITGQALITRANDILQDKTNVRWPEDEMLRWLNDGQRETVIYRPDSCVTTVPFQLASGATKQTLPANGIRFIDMPRNLGANGESPGKSIRVIAREVLDAQLPEWHSTPSRAVIEHYVFDMKVPKTFWVYPRPSSAIYVELQYSSAPTDLATKDDTIALDDVYANALVDYMLYRCYSKDAEYAANAGAAGAHYAAFQNALGIRTQADMAINPNQKLGRDATG